jgi:SAM-dependent methyltransferase
MVMDEPDAAAAFDRAGANGGPLLAQYELCARAMSSLLPLNGVVLDLGTGSARCLAHLAIRRPDVELYGVELSEPMLALGHRLLAEQNLGTRVHLTRGDITHSLDGTPPRVDLISCVLALHQLPTAADVVRALEHVAAIRAKTGCAIWLWDLARLSDNGVMSDWMSSGADPEALFLRDALASEAASWTFSELTDMLEDARLDGLRHCVARPPLLQAHWARRSAGGDYAQNAWRETPLSDELRAQVSTLRAGFQGLPI